MARQRNYAAEYAARIARAQAAGLSRSAARGHARPTEISASLQKIMTKRGATETQARQLQSMQKKLAQMKKTYTTDSDAYKNGRVEPDAAIGRMKRILDRLAQEPERISPDVVERFADAADMGATMRGDVEENLVRYTPERKKGNPDPAYTLWVDDLGNEPDDAPAYGTYDERG